MIKKTSIKKQFPILGTKVHGEGLTYLDNAATTQKPQYVIDAIITYYSTINANIHRGVYQLSEQATQAYDLTRQKVADFVGTIPEEVIFTSGTTESINLVAQSYGRMVLQPGDEIIVSEMEHHANLVPWQMIAQEKGSVIKVISMTKTGELDIEQYKSLLTAKTKIVAITHISNSLGTINPIASMITMAHEAGAKVVIDGAQAIGHIPVNIKNLDADFYAFSAHKLFGPTGIGVLVAKTELINSMPPYKTGGDMIESVTMQCSTFKKGPEKFEAGTPNIAGVIGLGAAIDFIQSIGIEAIQSHDQELLAYATQELQAINGLTIIGTAKEKSGIISFVLDGIHSHDLGTILDQYGIAIRTGQHCSQPVMDKFGVPATSRASFAIYNTKEDVDTLVEGIKKAQRILL